ncbi:hypothetical protein Syun_029533 [Stephania yunnanensis]|uniref:Uncharacterized protein n=1 Tax=Stephania yunnanensis TaxID=152371 RepID=A0AAP0E5R8_9MAGN
MTQIVSPSNSYGVVGSAKAAGAAAVEGRFWLGGVGKRRRRMGFIELMRRGRRGGNCRSCCNLMEEDLCWGAMIRLAPENSTIRAGGGDPKRSDSRRHIVDTFGYSMVERWLPAHADPSRMFAKTLSSENGCPMRSQREI